MIWIATFFCFHRISHIGLFLECVENKECYVQKCWRGGNGFDWNIVASRSKKETSIHETDFKTRLFPPT